MFDIWQSTSQKTLTVKLSFHSFIYEKTMAIIIIHRPIYNVDGKNEEEEVEKN